MRMFPFVPRRGRASGDEQEVARGRGRRPRQHRDELELVHRDRCGRKLRDGGDLTEDPLSGKEQGLYALLGMVTKMVWLEERDLIGELFPKGKNT